MCTGVPLAVTGAFGVFGSDALVGVGAGWGGVMPSLVTTRINPISTKAMTIRTSLDSSCFLGGVGELIRLGTARGRIRPRGKDDSDPAVLSRARTLAPRHAARSLRAYRPSRSDSTGRQTAGEAKSDVCTRRGAGRGRRASKEEPADFRLQVRKQAI